MPMRLLILGFAMLAFASPAGAMRVGIVDQAPLSRDDALALGVQLQRKDVLWNGETQAWSLALGAATPVVSVWGRLLPETQPERSAYCDFVHSLLELNPQVKYLIVWNEPKRYDLYGRLLSDCSPIIRSLGVQVVGPAMHPGGSAELAQLLDAIPRGALDVFDLHPYLHEYELDGLVDQIHHALGAIPVWVTEDGMDTKPGPNFSALYTGEPWSPAWDYWSEDQQADAVSRYMQLAYCAGVSAWFNFLLHDEVDLGRWQSGLERPDGSRKPSYRAFAVTAARIAKGAVDCAGPQTPPPAIWSPDQRLAQRLAETGGWTRDAYERTR